MPFCANCGAPVEGRFCAKCGAVVAAGGPPAGAGDPGAMPPPPSAAVPPPAAGPMAPPPLPASAGMADNVASTLCYVLGFITGIIFLLIEPYNRNRTIRFHAFQSIFLSVAAIAIRIVLLFLLTSLRLWDFFLFSTLISLAFFALWIFMLISTYQGKTIVLPVIGPLAQQQA
jgi:uncharacterized membrane protein